MLLSTTPTETASPEMIAGQNVKIREQALQKGKAKGIELDTAEKLLKVTGLKLRYIYEEGSGVDGFISGDTVTVNLASDTSAFCVAAHEVGHSMKIKNAEKFAAFQASVQRVIENTPELKQYADQIRADYTAENSPALASLTNADGTINTAALEEDVCLKTFERLIEDPERLAQAVAHDRSAIESFLDVLRGIKNSLVIKFTGSEKAMLDEAERTMVNLLRGEAGVVEGERFSYVGEDANLNDDERRALRDAKERLAKGEDPEEIRQDTNWFKGKDGKWRMEVDDSKAVYYPKGNARTIFPKRKGTVSDYLYHPELQRLMPDVFNLPMEVDRTLDPETNGSYRGRQEGIRVREGAGKSTVLHEVQHGIQDYLDFARGSNMDRASKWALILSYEAFKENPKYQALKTSEERFAYIKDMAKYATPYQTWKDAVWNYYDTAAGEVEARDVARRADYSEQRRTHKKPDTVGEPAFGNDPTLYFVDILSEMGYSKEKIKQILKEGV